jgi:hypothetical protein
VLRFLLRLWGVFGSAFTTPMRRFVLQRLCYSLAAPLLRFFCAFAAFLARKVDDEITPW